MIKIFKLADEISELSLLIDAATHKRESSYTRAMNFLINNELAVPLTHGQFRINRSALMDAMRERNGFMLRQSEGCGEGIFAVLVHYLATGHWEHHANGTLFLVE